MKNLFRNRKRKFLTWEVKRRAYPLLILRLSFLYLRSPTFRSVIRASRRHRKYIKAPILRKATKAYLLATNSRVTIAGIGAL